MMKLSLQFYLPVIVFSFASPVSMFGAHSMIMAYSSNLQTSTSGISNSMVSFEVLNLLIMSSGMSVFTSAVSFLAVLLLYFYFFKFTFLLLFLFIDIEFLNRNKSTILDHPNKCFQFFFTKTLLKVKPPRWICPLFPVYIINLPFLSLLIQQADSIKF